ncbi:MAG: GNAT family N-acetyltransferase, partial [Oscillospiraceae bacterium]|nr:GNAT family N-acetyltransferase [Oscillospiraceae bacterium]
MKNQITIREAITEADIAAFWGQLHTYHMRDIFPDSEDENRKHFLDNTEYRAQIQRVHDRQQDRCYYLFFHQNGQDIGFALPAIFTSEDGKCFILEFCIFPAFRGGGTGRSCADALLSWAKMRSARYAELNYGGDERRLRFWKRVGFVENGADE